MLQLLVSFGRIWVDAGHWTITAYRPRSLGSPPSLSRIKGNYAAFVSQQSTISFIIDWERSILACMVYVNTEMCNESHHQLNADYANDHRSRMNGRFLAGGFAFASSRAHRKCPVCLHARFSQRIVVVRPLSVAASLFEHDFLFDDKRSAFK